MKKVIYSLVTALILSVLLALLVPRLLFKGDARWTYQNDAARVDVSFDGHLKNGRVDAKGSDLKTNQPEWLSDHRFQGTVVEMPISYRTKSYQIKLTPQADEWGRDAVLVIKFRGKDFQYKGERKPAWVCFRNITLNGQAVAGEKIVWGMTPFMLRCPPRMTSEITLAFDVCKPLAASDISFANILVIFLAFFLFILFFAPLKKVADRVLSFISRKDIVNVLKDGYLHISPVCRRSFWIIFGGLCFAFGFHTICFMWGDHDWVLLDSTHRWSEHAYEGRYMLFSLKALFANGVYLPLIHDVITCVTLALNAVLLCKYWCLEKRVIYYVLCGLALTAQPFTLCMVYYVHMTPEVFLGVTYVLVALLLSEKAAITGISLTRKWIYSLIAIVLVNFALAMYPVLINTVAVVFAGRLLVHAFDWDGSWRQAKSCMRPCLISAFNIIVGIVLYKAIITFVWSVRSQYNTDTLTLAQVPERLGTLLKQSFHQLYEYDMPFLPQWILWMFLGFTIVLLLYVCSTGNCKQKVARLVLLFVSLFATQTAMVVAKTYVIDGRVELFGLVFFEVLVMMSVLTRLRKLHNLSVIAGTCIVFASVLHDLDCLRTWKLGFDAEKMLWNRVLARMEIQKDFDPTRKYDVVQIGKPIAMRPRYFTELGGKGLMRCGVCMYFAHDFKLRPFSAHQFYYPTRFRGAYFSLDQAHFSRDQGYEDRLKRLYRAGVLQKAEVWPKPNGLIVWKNIILFVTDGKELAKYKRRFERELGKR